MNISPAPIPGPYFAIDDRIYTVSDGKRTNVAQVSGSKGTAPNTRAAMADYMARCLNSHAQLLKMLELSRMALNDAIPDSEHLKYIDFAICTAQIIIGETTSPPC